MPTGNGSKGEPEAVGLRFAKDRLVVELDDEREVSVPLSRYPSLLKARPAARNDWKLIGPGRGFYSASLDLDLSVRGLVSGLPELIPAPPRRPAGSRCKPKPRRAGAGA